VSLNVWPETCDKAELELSLLRRLVDRNRDLIDKARQAEPNDLELTGLAAFLHSFYTGIESIFKRIAVEIDGGAPTGGQSHTVLLGSMAKPGATRSAVISEDLRADLWEYMNFRHVFRHAYVFDLRWRRMSKLVFNSESVLNRLEAELRRFFVSS